VMSKLTIPVSTCTTYVDPASNPENGLTKLSLRLWATDIDLARRHGRIYWSSTTEWVIFLIYSRKRMAQRIEADREWVVGVWPSTLVGGSMQPKTEVLTNHQMGRLDVSISWERADTVLSRQVGLSIQTVACTWEHAVRDESHDGPPPQATTRVLSCCQHQRMMFLPEITDTVWRNSRHTTLFDVTTSSFLAPTPSI